MIIDFEERNETQSARKSECWRLCVLLWQDKTITSLSLRLVGGEPEGVSE